MSGGYSLNETTMNLLKTEHDTIKVLTAERDALAARVRLGARDNGRLINLLREGSDLFARQQRDGADWYGYWASVEAALTASEESMPLG